MRRSASPYRELITALLLALGLLTIGVACQASLVTPPRLATAEASSPLPAATTPAPLIIPAPTPTESALSGGPVTTGGEGPAGITVWINETSDEHRQALTGMAADFNERTGFDVALQFVDPALLPRLAQTAVLSDTLPDLILHPLEFSEVWSEAGILDPAAADAIVDQLGRDTFDAGALDLVDVNGQTAAIPSDGYQQLWLYRSDWFEEADLDTPDNFNDMLDGVETLFDPDNLVYGLVVPTESNLINTQRAFEHLALANECHLIEETGEILLLDETCRSALDFYYSIINQFSPPGVQTDTSARNAFLDGRTALIMSDPSFLTDLVQNNRLNRQTGIVTRLNGERNDGDGANLGNITYLGVTPVANQEAAAAFANYWFNEGYQTWLAIESERKVPMRLGTSERPRFYIDDWGNAPILQGESLSDIFGPEVVAQLRDGIGTAERWGFSRGNGALAGEIYENLTLSVVLQEMLSGYFSSAETIFEAYNRVVELVPDYAFPIAPTPTPEA